MEAGLRLLGKEKKDKGRNKKEINVRGEGTECVNRSKTDWTL